jgi:hypothetical protein
MIEHVTYDVIPKRRWPPPEPWYLIAKVPAGALTGMNDPEAIRRDVRRKLRVRIPIVVMEGEPSDGPRLFGPPDEVANVRENLSAIATHGWAPLGLK